MPPNTSSSPGLQKIIVVGTSGAGKSTLARKISARLSCPHIELDDLFWQPGWVVSPVDCFKQGVNDSISADKWILCGNYSKVRQQVWEQADMVVWLDYPIWLSFWRGLTRSIKRIIDKKPVCNGNYETFANVFLSRDSVLLWILTSHFRRRREYEQELGNPAFEHVRFIRHNSPKTDAAMAGGAIMDITPLIGEDQKIISSYSPGQFRIGETVYKQSVIVFTDRVVMWDMAKPASGLVEEDFSALLDCADELDVVLFGSGAKMELLKPDLARALKEKGLIVESMDTGAACRTYAVMMAEGRRVAAALIPV